VLFKTLEFLYIARLNSNKTISNITIKIHVENTVFDIPKSLPNIENSHHGIISHCKLGICGQTSAQCSIVSVFNVSISADIFKNFLTK
jgi:hypothetical protein